MVLLGGGYFVPWQQLPPPPDTPVRLVSGDQFLPIIEIKDGTLFVYEQGKWHHLPSLQSDNIGTYVVSSECEPGRPSLQFTARPPQRIAQCLELHEVLFESSWHMMVVMDDRGKVWIWEEPDTWVYGLGSCSFPFLGAVTSGMLTAILVKRSRRKIKELA